MAKNLQNEQIEEYGKRRRQRRVLKRVLIGASLCVAFLAVYALVLPASTLEHPEPACGLEEHEHTEACFETQLVCQLPETGAHVHTQACYDAEDVTKLICEKPATGHLHTQKCFATGEELVCENTEADHEHGDGCYLEEGTLVCEEEETVHVHTDACYELVEPETADGQEAVEGDNAQAAEDLEGAEAQADVESAEAQPESDPALDADVEASDPVDQKPEYRLTCDKEADGHVHFSQCYDDEGNLTCTEEEAVEVAHEHEDACSEEVAVCGLEAHNHDEVCYDPETLQMIQATKENKEAQEAEEAAKAEEAETTPEPVSDDELEALKAKGLAWENENMVVTFTLPEDTKEEVRFEVTELPTNSIDLGSSSKIDEDDVSHLLQIKAFRGDQSVDYIEDVGAKATFMAKTDVVDRLLSEVDFTQVADDVKDEIGVDATITQLPNATSDLLFSEQSGAIRAEDTFSDSKDVVQTVRLQGGIVSYSLSDTPNPSFTVKYSANVETALEYKDVINDGNYSQYTKKPLHLIDTTGKTLPKNGDSEEVLKNSNRIKELALIKIGSISDIKEEEKAESEEERYYSKYPDAYNNNEVWRIATELKKTPVYADRAVRYHAEPNLKYFDVLRENEGYKLESLTIEHSLGNNCTVESNVPKIEGENVYRVHFTNRPETYLANKYDTNNPTGYLLIDDDTTITLNYSCVEVEQLFSATLYDYDITNGAMPKPLTLKQGINSDVNYPLKGDKPVEGARFAFGNGNTKMGLEDENLNGYLINQAEKKNFRLCSFGLVENKLGENDTPEFVNSKNENALEGSRVVGPEIFGDGKVVGKSIFEDYGLAFNQIGDTYTIEKVYKPKSSSKDKPVLDNLSQFISRDNWNQTLTMYSNEFWAADECEYEDADADADVATNVVKHDPLFGDPSGPLVSDKTLPVADFGLDHNAYFGMEYTVEFNLDESYVGPLEYYFFGDDDMWVYLDGELVCDIGGVHNAVGEYVNLWDWVGNTVNGVHCGDGESHKLKFFYTERGASGSTCYMRFTLPSVTSTQSKETSSLKIEKQLLGNVLDIDQEFDFEISLKDSAGNYLPDDYSYTKYDSEGNVVGAPDLVCPSYTNLQLKAGQYIVIKFLPPGTIYEVNEIGYEPEVLIDGEEIDQLVASGETTQGEISEVLFINSLYELPATGGSGSTLFLLIGGGLILLALGFTARNHCMVSEPRLRRDLPFSEESESRHSRRPNLVRRGARARQEGRNHYW